MSSIKSKLACLILGDGYLTKSDRLELCHGEKQKDFLEYKTSFIASLFNKGSITVSKNKKLCNGTVCFTYSSGMSLKQHGFKGIRKEFYGDSKKNYLKILNSVLEEDKTFLLAMWLADDGAVGRRITNGVVNSAHLDIFSCDQPSEVQEELRGWLKDKFDVSANIKTMVQNKTNRRWLYLSFNQQDSMVLWSQIRKILLPIPSMAHKFRHIEEKFNRSFSYLEYNPFERPQPPTNEKELTHNIKDLIESYAILRSSYKVADKFNISATAVKRMLKQAGVLRTQSKAALIRTKI